MVMVVMLLITTITRLVAGTVTCFPFLGSGSLQFVDISHPSKCTPFVFSYYYLGDSLLYISGAVLPLLALARLSV